MEHSISEGPNQRKRTRRDSSNDYQYMADSQPIHPYQYNLGPPLADAPTTDYGAQPDLFSSLSGYDNTGFLPQGMNTSLVQQNPLSYINGAPQYGLPTPTAYGPSSDTQQWLNGNSGSIPCLPVDYTTSSMGGRLDQSNRTNLSPQFTQSTNNSAFPSSILSTQATDYTAFSTSGDNFGTFEMPTLPSEVAATRASSKRPMSSFDSGNSYEAQPDAKHPRLLQTHLIETTDKQERILELHRREWEAENHIPTKKEMDALATLTGLKPDRVAMWVGRMFQVTPGPSRCRIPTTPTIIEPEVLTDIERYIQEAKGKNCSSSHSIKAPGGGKYRCTSRCGYSTDSRNAWERHEEKKQPQRFWHCIRCRELEQPAFIASRFDKFLPHADACHPQRAGHPEDDKFSLRERSHVPYDAPFQNRCTFRLKPTGNLCNTHFLSWKDRNDHYIRHFEESDYFDELDDDDSSDGSSGPDRGFWPPAPSNEFGGGQYHNTGNSNSHSGGSGGNGGYSGSNNYSCHGNLNKSNSFSVGPHNCLPLEKGVSELCFRNNNTGVGEATDLAVQWLIRVRDYRIVEAIPGLRYLALEYLQHAPLPCLQSASNLQRPTLPLAKHLPIPFQKALSLAKDMAFEYMWIDLFCGLKKDADARAAAYRQANLILVLRYCSQNSEQIWHSTCDYSDLPRVQYWAAKSVSFHHQKQLGHGAYSVVDKVQLQPTLEIFARKIVFRSPSKRAIKARQVQEIEIMRKLHHPHVARFVAAYYDQTALNILMSPVADCDLRSFLACSNLSAEQLQHLSTWYMSLAEALAYVHSQRCRHKDIKPANILVKNNKVLLTDFGTSLDFSSTSISTSTGGAFMTPKYCAPEVAAKRDRGRSADVFSLGCVFAEMITVELGKTLDDLHRWLRMDEESSDSHATYHNHLTQLFLWLRTLARLRPKDHLKRVLHVTAAMISAQPAKRPSALAITQALCHEKPCTGLHMDATCHCCPRRRPAAVTAPSAASQRQSTNVIPSLRDVGSLAAPQGFLFKAYVAWMASSFSKKDHVGGSSSITLILHAPQHPKVETGSLFVLQWNNLTHLIDLITGSHANDSEDDAANESDQYSGRQDPSALTSGSSSSRSENRRTRRKNNASSSSFAQDLKMQQGSWSLSDSIRVRKQLRALTWRGEGVVILMRCEIWRR